MEREPVIQFTNCTKLFGNKTVLRNISFEVNEENLFTTILGKSGSGKTTLLRLLAGLEKPDEGSIAINGKELFKVQDDTFKEGGLVGVWTKADAQTFFDELAIQSLK